MSDAQSFVFELPGSLSLRRNAVVSDARMYSLVNGQFSGHPVKVIRHGIRATNNTLKAGEGSGETSTTVAADDVRNLQEIDSAKLDPDATGLVVEFSFALTDLSQAISGISPDKDQLKDPQYVELFRKSVMDFIGRARSGAGFEEVCNRIARNVLNARWLWRNRLIASSVRTCVHQGDELVCERESLEVPLREFSGYDAQENKLGRILADQLSGRSLKPLIISAFVETLGHGAIEVYPSQNYIPGARDDDSLPSRSLYVLNKPLSRQEAGPRIVGEAAMRDQKIWNALRTIDTWYEDGANVTPIAVEPLGASLSELRFFRSKDKTAFSLLERLNELDPTSPDGMFMLAALIRGGVYTRPKTKKK
jgi:CRISPR-associated protein Csy3